MKVLSGGSVALAMSGALYADNPAPTNAPTAATNAPSASAVSTNAEPGTLDALFNRDLPDAIGKSKVHFQWRPRYEYADAQGSEPSNALTMRTVFGLTSAQLYGFQGMLEGINVTAIGDSDNYFYPGNPSAAGKTTIADPPLTDLNQAWLSYTYTNWATGAKGGRQVINLDNQRFIGSVDWRQNPQTFDGIRLDNSKLDNATFGYTYVDRVNRVFGNIGDLPNGAQDYKSSSHLLHATYDTGEYADIVGYIYLLDIYNDAGSVPSCASYGFSVTGRATVSEKFTLDYRGEFAWQTDYADNPNDYSAPYLHLTLGTELKPVKFGAGYELLGSDNDVGFQTPLATLHKFNGWADVFLNTPPDGLQDMYLFGTVQLPWELPLTVMLHKFNAAAGGGYNYGNEIDVSISRKFGKHWTGLLKYSYYDSKNELSPGGFDSDVQKFWAQINFSL